MQNTNNNFKIVRNDYGSFTQETWEIHGYTLIRTIDVDAPQDGAEWSIHHDRELPGLVNTNTIGTRKVVYGVDSSAMDTKIPAQVAEAAEILSKIRNSI